MTLHFATATCGRSKMDRQPKSGIPNQPKVIQTTNAYRKRTQWTTTANAAVAATSKKQGTSKSATQVCFFTDQICLLSSRPVTSFCAVQFGMKSRHATAKKSFETWRRCRQRFAWLSRSDSTLDSVFSKIKYYNRNTAQYCESTGPEAYWQNQQMRPSTIRRLHRLHHHRYQL